MTGRIISRQITETDTEHLVDIPTMRAMHADDYFEYVSSGLFFVDHHDILRDSVIEYPIATTSRQVELLIKYLEGVKRRMQEAEE